VQCSREEDGSTILVPHSLWQEIVLKALTWPSVHRSQIGSNRRTRDTVGLSARLLQQLSRVPVPSAVRPFRAGSKAQPANARHRLVEQLPGSYFLEAPGRDWPNPFQSRRAPQNGRFRNVPRSGSSHWLAASSATAVRIMHAQGNGPPGGLPRRYQSHQRSIKIARGGFPSTSSAPPS
jgi:hypothetical protein